MSNTRRAFLQTGATLAAGLAAATPAGAQAPAPASVQVPKVKFGKAEISRIVLGGNPLYGVSHFNQTYDRVMREWCTPSKVVEIMHQCEAYGINAFQHCKHWGCRGPLVIDKPVTLRGLDRKTVVWRRGGPVIYIRTPGVTLERILIERTVETQGPLIVHNVGCAPTGRESMQLDTLISLGELVPGSTLILPLEIETAGRAELMQRSEQFKATLLDALAHGTIAIT